MQQGASGHNHFRYYQYIMTRWNQQETTEMWAQTL